jgi:hypothetical protein
MSYVYPSPNNVYVPSVEATGSLLINLVKNPDKFQFNKYLGIRNVDKMEGRYIIVNPDDNARSLSADSADIEWADGNDLPSGSLNAEAHDFPLYGCKRYAETVGLGDLTVKQASWDILASHGAGLTMKLMTAKTRRILNVLTTSANWGASATTATALGGGTFASADTTNENIKSVFLGAVKAIKTATNDVVNENQIQCIMSMNTALTIATSQEYTDTLKQSYWAGQIIEGKPPVAAQLGLPMQVYGVPVIIDSTIAVTSKKGATRVAINVMPDNVVVFVARPDALEGYGSGQTYNTITSFVFEPFNLSTIYEPKHRRTLLVASEIVSETLTAPATGLYVSGC